jgi:glycosyltransferase involved in cell wall biosynthesis
MLVLFWASISMIVYTYLGYPLSLMALSCIKSRAAEAGKDYLPPVTLVVTVFNEDRRIEKKIANTLDLNYPKDKLEIIFASDASTDGTDDIIRNYSGKGIKLARSPRRGGKENAQKCAIEHAQGEIIVFSDVATMLEKDGIRNIVSNFADPSIGCVSSEDRFINPDGTISGEGAYVKYEMWLRALESRINSVVGLSGSFFAARKNVCGNWPTGIPSDFNTLLNTIRAGYRGISDPRSIGIYNNIRDEKKEFDRKVRTITRGISALFANAALMNPAGHGLFSWQLISHKLLRWCVPWFLAMAFIANLFLLSAGKLKYNIILIMQLILYGLALTRTSNESRGIIKIPHYFVQVNWAIAVAWVKFLKGERYVTWSPSKR